MIEINEAGPMNFLRTLLFIVLIYYAFKFLMRLFGPYIMKKMVNKMKQKAEEQFGNEGKPPTTKEGETIIDKKPQGTKKSNDSVGEYVDFEEID